MGGGRLKADLCPGDSAPLQSPIEITEAGAQIGAALAYADSEQCPAVCAGMTLSHSHYNGPALKLLPCAYLSVSLMEMGGSWDSSACEDL